MHASTAQQICGSYGPRLQAACLHMHCLASVSCNFQQASASWGLQLVASGAEKAVQSTVNLAGSSCDSLQEVPHIADGMGRASIELQPAC